MFVIVLGVGLVLTVLAYLIGTPILSLVFGLPLNQHSTTLAILCFFWNSVFYWDCFWGCRDGYSKQTYLLPVYLFMFIASKLTNNNLVQKMGLLGASLSFSS